MRFIHGGGPQREEASREVTPLMWGPAARGSRGIRPHRAISPEKASGRRGDIEDGDAVCFLRLVAVNGWTED